MNDDDDLEWETRTRPRPQFVGELLPEDPAREFDAEDTLAFFTKLSEGYGPLMIGLSMGWTPAMVDRFVKEPSRAEIIDMITEADNEQVEHAIRYFAKAGNSTAMKLWAFNKMSHRGWADRREVRTTIEGQAEMIVSVRQALNEHTRELVQANGHDAIAALQAAFLDDAEIVDAEIVE